MADNKKYYYLKIKENFYDSEEMIILQGMPDGYLYSDILMKLYLRSLKDGGQLIFRGTIPYSPEVLAQVVRHQVGTVTKALEIFEQLGLIEILDNGAIYMSDIQNLIGKSSTEADRIREYRAKISKEKQNVVQMYRKRTPEIEIEKEIELDIEKDIELDSKEEIASLKVSKKRFKKPTLEEISNYCSEINYELDAQQFYDYYESNGWKVGRNPMKDWKATLRQWKARESKQISKPKPKTVFDLTVEDIWGDEK